MIVYRLENEQGFGPFWCGQCASNFLKPHKDPEEMMKLSGLNRKCFNRLSSAGWIFGWESLELYRQFFKQGGEDACNNIGFTLHTYQPTAFVRFIDGQVMFKRP